MSSLTEKEKEALLADLAGVESLEAQIDERYYRMTDENAEQLFTVKSTLSTKNSIRSLTVMRSSGIVLMPSMTR